MLLQNLIEKIEVIGIAGPTDREVLEITCDSREVKAGSMFIALPGESKDGASFASAAIKAGANTVVSEQDMLAAGATTVKVRNARQSLADLSAEFFGHPDRNLKVVGITGTNGKTTTSFLVKQICERFLWRCGLIGTVRYQIGERVLPATRTTPEAPKVYELLREMVDAGCKVVAMEVSSHSLAQERVRGVQFDAAVFTNVTRDHLDYHKTMEAYFESKASLFTRLSEQSKVGKAIVNIDDRYGHQLVQMLNSSVQTITYGRNARADFRASNVRIDFNGTSFQLDANGKSYLVRSPLIGIFNVYNVLAAIAAAWTLNIGIRQSLLALSDMPAVPGRLQAIPGHRSFRVFVDYAHTDDALLNVIKTCRELKPSRVIVVFGCGGNRDRGKRSRMGSVVDQNADYAIVTSDNPRKEPVERIIRDILVGMPTGRNEVIVDRQAAIQKAISMARPHDIVIIAGKGHEAYQEFEDCIVPFDDVAVATAAVADQPEPMK